MIVVNVTKRVIATTGGTVIKAVTCEKCSTEFYYQMTRVGKGTANASLLFSDGSERSEAHEEARQELIRKLEQDHELVPCPQCGWVNDAAIRAYRKMRYTDLNSYGLCFLGSFVLCCIGSVRDVWRQKPLSVGILLLMGASLILGCGLLGLCAVLRRRIDPNGLTSRGERKLLAGTPPALIRDAAGEFVEAPGGPSRVAETSEWATYRGLIPEFEPVCCECLEEPTTTFALPFTLMKPLPVPMCATCLGQLRRRFWLWAVVVLTTGAVVSYLLACLITRGGDVLRPVAAVGIGAMLGYISLCMVGAWLAPYRWGGVDETRALRKIAFRNPAYTALLVRKYAQQDAVHAPASSHVHLT